jgi:hypothetical protein
MWRLYYWVDTYKQFVLKFPIFYKIIMERPKNLDTSFFALGRVAKSRIYAVVGLGQSLGAEVRLRRCEDEALVRVVVTVPPHINRAVVVEQMAGFIVPRS